LIPWNEIILFIFAVGARGAIFAAFSVIYIYTPEMYPTVIRSIALGACGSVSRIGGMATPFISNMLESIDSRIPMIIYSLVCILSAILVLFLPIETNGKKMSETIEEKEIPIENETIEE
jgi:MFS family permease